MWGIVLGRSLTDPIWWFYVFWLPKYLSDARGFSLKQIAAFAWLPFVASDIGNFTGGLASGYLIKRGFAVVRSRKWVCILSSLPILAGIPAALASNPSQLRRRVLAENLFGVDLSPVAVRLAELRPGA